MASLLHAVRWLGIAGCVLMGSACTSGVRDVDPAVFVGADIVILGEVHDNPEHHRRQARVIAALAPAAVVFEMLSAEQAALANATPVRDERLAVMLDWSSSGWPDWGLYQPVFAAVGTIPIVGMAVPRETLNVALTAGAAAAFGEGADRFGLTRPLPADQQARREAHQQAVHCGKLPGSMLPGMVEAQRLRDASFARAALTALENNGSPVVVLTGSGHARTDWGIPAALRQAAPDLSVVSLGQMEAVKGQAAADATPYDYRWVAPPAPREDPCAAFSVSGR